MMRILVVIFYCLAAPALADLSSLFVSASAPLDQSQAKAARASLFAPQSERSFFAPLPDARPVVDEAPLIGTGEAPIDQLLNLIAQAEAGSKGYDAVQYGARVLPKRPPTDLTLGEIYVWIDETPGQPHAIGRYQFIPPTLLRVAAARGFGPETRFTSGVQDALALVLLEDAGFAEFQQGRLDRRDFMRNLARIWAGLPLPNGRSFYEGHAGNSATMTWATFEGGMAQIWPTRG